MTEKEKHAKYSASKISRIIRCPGSEDFVQYLINMKEIPPEETTGAADEGTMLHAQQELNIEGKPLSDDLDAEQLSCIEANRDWLLTLQDKHKFNWAWTEQKFGLDGYGIEDSGGTADVVAGSNNSLHVIDWKFGKGVAVYVEKNEQLMTYLLGAAQDEDKLNEYDELWIHLGQPRLDYFASYQCSVDELLSLAGKIKEAIKSHDIVAGEEQCFWCRGKTRCAEYEDTISINAAKVFKVSALMKENFCDFKLTSKALELKPFFKKVFKAIKDAYKEMTPGQLAEVDMKWVAGRSTRAYVSEESVVEYLCVNYENIEDIYTDPKLKTPAQLEKAIKGLKKDKNFQKLIHKPIGKPTIVSINDKRPEYSNGAAETFAHLKKE